MRSRLISQEDKKVGVHYAITADGLELPIVDITHPAFSLVPTEAEQRALVERFLSGRHPLEWLPARVRNPLYDFFLSGSMLGRHLTNPNGSFLGGLATYLMKLGPDNLGPHAKHIDKLIAALLPARALRWRLQDVSHLLADAIRGMLVRDALTPVHLINIAGGPALDSLNALLLVHRAQPALLRQRRVVVSVLDGERGGPAFGARALDSWLETGAPLAGIDVVFRFVPYDWHRTEPLAGVLDEARAEGAHVAASSEGGLFEYGSDEVIVANLGELRERAPHDVAIIGSVTRADAPIRRLLKTSSAALRPRGLAVFRALAQRAGFAVTRAIERPFSDDVMMVRSPATTGQHAL